MARRFIGSGTAIPSVQQARSLVDELSEKPKPKDRHYHPPHKRYGGRDFAGVGIFACANCRWYTEAFKKRDGTIRPACRDKGIEPNTTPCKIAPAPKFAYFEPVKHGREDKIDLTKLQVDEIGMLHFKTWKVWHELVRGRFRGFSFGQPVEFYGPEGKVMTGVVVGMTRYRLRVETQYNERFSLQIGDLVDPDGKK